MTKLNLFAKRTIVEKTMVKKRRNRVCIIFTAIIEKHF